MSAASAGAQVLGGAPSDSGPSLWRLLLALTLCLFLAVAGAAAIRARMGGRGLPKAFLFAKGGSEPRRLRMIESIRIGQQVDLCIVAWDDREYLVSASGQTATLLDRQQRYPEAEAQ